VNLAIELGVPKDRIDTIIDFAAAQQYGVKTEGSQEGRNARILAELAGLVAEGKLDVPVAATFPRADVRAAFPAAGAGAYAGKDRSRAVIAFAAGAPSTRAQYTKASGRSVQSAPSYAQGLPEAELPAHCWRSHRPPSSAVGSLFKTN
jgi:hypothetical protein